MGNTHTVQVIYEAFGRGDVPAILEKLDDGIEWETQAPVPGVPWLQPRHGKANVVGFFEALAPHDHPLRATHRLRRRQQGLRAHCL